MEGRVDDGGRECDGKGKIGIASEDLQYAVAFAAMAASSSLACWLAGRLVVLLIVRIGINGVDRGNVPKKNGVGLSQWINTRQHVQATSGLAFDICCPPSLHDIEKQRIISMLSEMTVEGSISSNDRYLRKYHARYRCTKRNGI